MMERKRKANRQVYSKKAKKARKNKNNKGADEDEEEELFSWEEYLKKTCSKAVPQSTFKHVHDPVGQGFVPGMKVEALNRTFEQGETYWVATIVTVSGPLLLLRYDGSEEDRSGDFWCDAASEDLQPIGWCARTNHMLLPPESIRHKESNWAKFLTNDLKDKSVHAPENLFHKQAGQEDGVLPPGTKVELLNEGDPLSYWLTSVVESYGMRLQLRYEGIEDEDHDVWIYYLSERVHELGWGIQHSLVLRPPSVLTAAVQDLATVADKILGTCHSSSKPTSPLNSKPAVLPREHNLTVAMKLEAIHPDDPSCICVATVSKILNAVYFQVQIDSLISCSDKKPVFCAHANSRSIFPVGWCESNNITLTPPPGYHALPFSWERYLKWTNSVAAPTDLFDLTVPEHGFGLDLKLEAVDQTNPAVVTVGTVTQVVGRTVWVHLDGIQDDAVEHIYDVESHDLLPAGWGSTHGHPLQTPRITFKDTKDRNRISTRLRQRQKQINESVSETSDSEEKKKSDPKPEKKLDKAPIAVHEKKESKKQENTLASKLKGKNLQIKKNLTLKVKLPTPKDSDVDYKPTSSSVSTQSSAKIKPYTPKAKTTLVSPGETTSQQKAEPVTSSVDVVDLTDEDLPIDKVPEKGNDKAEAPQHTVCIHLKTSCKAGPYLNPKKLKEAVTIMGPLTPDAALKKLLECIVHSSHKSRQVLDILSNERDKKTFWSILQTLHIKLKFCPNLFTLRKVLVCSMCDKPAVVRVSPVVLASKSIDRTALPTRSTRSTIPVQSEAKPSATATVTSPRKSSSAPVSSASKNTGRPVVSKTTTGKPVVSRRPVGGPPKHSVKSFDKPVKPAAKSARRSGAQSPKAAELPTVLECEPTPQSPDVSLAAFVMPTGSHISSWNVTDVVQFIRSTDCSQFANVFQEQEIDGKALVLLSLDEIHKCLEVTLGPAIKLHNYVQTLRKRPR